MLLGERTVRFLHQKLTGLDGVSLLIRVHYGVPFAVDPIPLLLIHFVKKGLDVRETSEVILLQPYFELVFVHPASPICIRRNFRFRFLWS